MEEICRFQNKRRFVSFGQNRFYCTKGQLQALLIDPRNISGELVFLAQEIYCKSFFIVRFCIWLGKFSDQEQILVQNLQKSALGVKFSDFFHCNPFTLMQILTSFDLFATFSRPNDLQREKNCTYNKPC